MNLDKFFKVVSETPPEVKEEVKKIMDSWVSLQDKVKEKEMDKLNLRLEINNLLFSYLPPDLTLIEMEILAVVINDMIWNPRDYIAQKETE